MIIRYVNTASTAGGDGTTNGTIGTTRAFASLQEAFNYLQTVDPLSDDYTIYCEGTAADTLSPGHEPMEFYTNGFQLHVIGEQSVNHPTSTPTGKYDTSKYRIELTNDAGIYNQYARKVWIDGIQIKLTCNTSGVTSYCAFRLATANNDGAVDHLFTNCIAWLVASGTDNAIGWTDSDPNGQGGTCYRKNCISYGGYCGFNSDESAWAVSNLKNYNCIAYGAEFNYMGAQGNVNCISANPTLGYGFGFYAIGAAPQSYNSSDDDTATGTGSLIDQTFGFVDTATGDFHLLISDTGAKNHGIGPSENANVLAYDIDGDTRSGSVCDIGPDESYVFVGGVDTPLKRLSASHFLIPSFAVAFFPSWIMGIKNRLICARTYSGHFGTEAVLTARTRLADQYLVCVTDGYGTILETIPLTQAQYEALGLPDAGPPPGVSTQDWTSGKAFAAGGVRNYDTGKRTLEPGEYAELTDQFEIRVKREDGGYGTLNILKSKIDYSTINGLSLTKTSADAWSENINLQLIKNDVMTMKD